MNFIDQGYVALIYIGSELYKHIHIIIGVVLAMTISFLKASKDSKKQNWVENILCGIFACIALTGITVIQFLVGLWFNLPEGMVIPTSLLVGVVSGVIAWHGTDGTWGNAGSNSSAVGGAGGKAIVGNSYITWIAVGTRNGAIT